MSKGQTRTQENEKLIKDLFVLFDKNKNNTISNEEFKLVLTAFSDNISNKEIENIMKDMGVKKGQEVEYDKFAICIDRYLAGMDKPTTKKDAEDQMKNAFKVFDKNGDGVIIKAELKAVLTKVGEPLSEKEVDEMLNTADADKDGKISYKEFTEMFTQFPKL